MSESTVKRGRLKLLALIAIPLAVLGVGLAYAHQRGGHHGGMMSAEGIAAHLDQVQGVLGRIGASEAQKSRIDGILKAAFDDCRAVHDGHHAAFGKFHQLLLAPDIDRNQIEALRAGQVKSLDDASKRFVTAMADAVEVLTPEQRAAFAREAHKHHRD
jgi:Spy/CpxP family protein refolding chaperone